MDGSWRPRTRQGLVSFGVTQGMPGQGPVLSPGVRLRPELADVGRLWRRLARQVLGAARADEAPSLPRVLVEHLGPQVGELPVVGDAWPPYEHVNLQMALDHWLSAQGRSHQLIGITGFQNRMFSLADLSQPMTVMHGPGIGSVAFESVACGPDGQTLSCVRCGLYLVDDDGQRLAVLFREEAQHGPRGRGGIAIEVLCPNPARGSEVLQELRDLALRQNVFRGQILSFDREMFGPGSGLLRFLERPQLREDDLVLPEGTLELTERQVLGVAVHRERLRRSGQHLKRGVLLHGPPGTGKTYTVRYLLSRSEGTTVILLSGPALGMISQACSIARALQPSIIVVEDVDLIAEQRGMHPGQHPLLFQLLNEMDGLTPDVDVAFILTTNRPDLLEPALADRPGRVDQAVEIPLPDAGARRRLIELYRGNLRLDGAETGPAVERTEGVTASFIKELLRRAALIRAETDGAGTGAITLTNEDLAAALDQLLDEGNRLTRVLLGGAGPTTPSATPPRPGLTGMG
ncbi:MAG: AAA family ATPase [Acidimicrobiales bacterium]